MDARQVAEERRQSVRLDGDLMTLDKATIARIRAALETYRMAVAKQTCSPLERELMADRLGKLFIANGEEILRVLEAR